MGTPCKKIVAYTSIRPGGKLSRLKTALRFLCVTLLCLLPVLSGGCARHRHDRPLHTMPVAAPGIQSAVPCAWPVSHPTMQITSCFGEPRSGGRRHKGLDIAAPRGTAVTATAPGKTSFAGTQKGYGKLVIIDHCNGYETAYAHLDTILTSCSSPVRRGTIIGRLGATGNATGPHLHYEVRRNGLALDPAPFLP